MLYPIQLESHTFDLELDFVVVATIAKLKQNKNNYLFDVYMFTAVYHRLVAL